MTEIVFMFASWYSWRNKLNVMIKIIITRCKEFVNEISFLVQLEKQLHNVQRILQ